MSMDKINRMSDQGCDSSYRSTTVRERLLSRLQHNELEIKRLEIANLELHNAIKTLDKNKDLETIVNILQG